MLALTARGTELSGEPCARRLGQAAARLRDDPGDHADTFRRGGDERAPAAADRPGRPGRGGPGGGLGDRRVPAVRRRGGTAPGGARPARAARPPTSAPSSGRRFDQLADGARQVAGLAAAIGRDFDLELLCEASDLDADAVVRAVDELWRLRILHETRRGYDFSHDLLRDTAYEQVSPPGRWLLHRRLAQALELLHAGRTDEVAAQLADQYARAGNGATGARVLPSRRRGRRPRLRARRGDPPAPSRAPTARGAAGRHRPGPARDPQPDLDVGARSTPIAGTPTPSSRGPWSGPATLAERLSLRDTLMDALVGLWSSRFVSGDIASPMPWPRGRSRSPTAARAGGTQRPGPLRVRRLGAVARQAGDGAASTSSSPAPGRPDERVAQHRQPPGDPRPGLVRPRRLAARRAAIAPRHTPRRPSSAPARSTTPTAWRSRSPTPPSPGSSSATSSCLEEATGELARLCARHGFAYYPAWGLVLERLGARTTRPGSPGSSAGSPTCGGRGVRPDALLAEPAGRARPTDPGRARAVLDAAVVAARVRRGPVVAPRGAAHPRDPVRDRLRGVRGRPRRPRPRPRARAAWPCAERCRARPRASPRTPAERPLP